MIVSKLRVAKARLVEAKGPDLKSHHDHQLHHSVPPVVDRVLPHCKQLCLRSLIYDEVGSRVRGVDSQIRSSLWCTGDAKSPGACL